MQYLIKYFISLKYFYGGKMSLDKIEIRKRIKNMRGNLILCYILFINSIYIFYKLIK